LKNKLFRLIRDNIYPS